jgi:hypothetical protein
MLARFEQGWSSPVEGVGWGVMRSKPRAGCLIGVELAVIFGVGMESFRRLLRKVVKSR